MRTLRIDEIQRLEFGEFNVSTEPETEQIKEAVDTGNVEKRGFQEFEQELRAEWEQRARDEYIRATREYHARRVAYFVLNPCDEPIRVISQNQLKDGAHRLLAAMYLGEETINCF